MNSPWPWRHDVIHVCFNSEVVEQPTKLLSDMAVSCCVYIWSGLFLSTPVQNCTSRMEPMLTWCVRPLSSLVFVASVQTRAVSFVVKIECEYYNLPVVSAGTLEFSDTHSDMSYVFINDSSQTSVPQLQACIDGDLPFAKRLLETGCDPNIRDNRGRTGLHLAAARGNVDICRLLHKFGADLLATDYQGNTALHLCGHVDTIQFLVSNGLKIDIW